MDPNGSNQSNPSGIHARSGKKELGEWGIQQAFVPATQLF